MGKKWLAAVIIGVVFWFVLLGLIGCLIRGLHIGPIVASLQDYYVQQHGGRPANPNDTFGMIVNGNPFNTYFLFPLVSLITGIVAAEIAKGLRTFAAICAVIPPLLVFSSQQAEDIAISVVAAAIGGTIVALQYRPKAAKSTSPASPETQRGGK